MPPEMVAAMMAVRQDPWAAGTRTPTSRMREHSAAMGRANKGRPLSSSRRVQISQQTRGAGNPKAKLTEVDVREIKLLLAAGARNKDLAEQFGVHPNSISKIKRGEVWPHIT